MCGWKKANEFYWDRATLAQWLRSDSGCCDRAVAPRRRYGVDMDFMGCTVLNDANDKNAGKHWVARSDSRCTATGNA